MRLTIKFEIGAWLYGCNMVGYQPHEFIGDGLSGLGLLSERADGNGSVVYHDFVSQSVYSMLVIAALET